MKRNMRLKSYWKPTPVKWRKLGDALLAVSTTITGYAIVASWEKWVTLTALLLGGVGKFLTNFFTDDPVIIVDNGTDVDAVEGK